MGGDLKSNAATEFPRSELRSSQRHVDGTHEAWESGGAASESSKERRVRRAAEAIGAHETYRRCSHDFTRYQEKRREAKRASSNKHLKGVLSSHKHRKLERLHLRTWGQPQ